MTNAKTTTKDYDDNVADREIRDWLLRRLDAQRCDAIERQLFVDASLAERIDAVECDLIDDCARGRLPAADAGIVLMRDAWRVRFAKGFAELQRPVATLPSRRSRMPTVRRVGFGFALAASLLLTVAGIRWTAMVTMPAGQGANAAMPVVTLLAGQQRGAAPLLNLAALEGDIRLQAEIDDDSVAASSRYGLSVADGERVLFVAHGLAPRSTGPYRFVETILPATVLGPEVRRIVLVREGAPDSSTTSWDVRMDASR